MKLFKIPENTTISPLGMPRYKEGGPEAVLLIHGFTGIAQEFYYLFDRIADEGYTVSLPRLPGHGTNIQDFKASTAADWLRRVTDEYLLLKTRYEKIHVAGLSMGGLLALILAEEFTPDSLTVMAPAISIRNKGVHLSAWLKHIIPHVKGDWTPEKERDELRREHGKEYWTRNYTGKVAEMMKLRKRALKNLSHIDSRILTIVSEGDKTVSPDALNIIESGVRSSVKEHLVLKESPHVLVNGCDKEEVADRLIGWFKQE